MAPLWFCILFALGLSTSSPEHSGAVAHCQRFESTFRCAALRRRWEGCTLNCNKRLHKGTSGLVDLPHLRGGAINKADIKETIYHLYNATIQSECNPPHMREPEYPPNWEDSYTAGRPTLWSAARVGDLQTLREAIERDPACVNTWDEDYRTPLHWAVSAGHIETVRARSVVACLNWQVRSLGAKRMKWRGLGEDGQVEYLIQRGGRVDTVDEGGWSPIHSAAAAVRLKIIGMRGEGRGGVRKDRVERKMDMATASSIRKHSARRHCSPVPNA